MNKKSTLALSLVLIALSYCHHAQALFCYVQKYSQPESNREIWLLGDTHLEIDPKGRPTRFQQHTLLQAAKQRDALVIAENADVTSYNPYLILAASCGIYAFERCMAAYLNGHDINTILGDNLMVFSALTPLSVSLYLLDQREKNKKPTVCAEEYIRKIKANFTFTQLPLLENSPLINLVRRCSDEGISAIDAEFRFHMVGACIEDARSQAPWFKQADFLIAHTENWITRKVTGNKVRYPLTLSDYCQVNDDIIKEIQTTSSVDLETLQPFYDDCLRAYSESYITKILRSLAAEMPHHSLSTVMPILVEKSEKNNDPALWRDFMEHNKELFDARIIHQIYKNRAHPTIFVCVGVKHMDNIGAQLEKLGYQMMASYGEDNYKKLEEAGVGKGQFIQVKDLEYLTVDLENIFSATQALAIPTPLSIAK